MVNNPKVSILMSVYNESVNDISISIDSILNQTLKDFEFIIVLDDPNNSDAKKLLQSYQKKDKRIVFLENKKNSGLGYSLNRGIKLAKGKYIARMDTCDIVDKNKLKLQFDYLDKNNNIDLVFSWWVEIDENKNKYYRKPESFKFENINKYFFGGAILLHASMMVKTEILKENNYLVMSRPEDFVLFLKLIKKGYEFGVVQKVLYTYYNTRFNPEEKYKKVRVYSKNYFFVLLKEIKNYKFNFHFWKMLFIVFIEYILSRSKFIFYLFYLGLEKIYKRLFL